MRGLLFMQLTLLRYSFLSPGIRNGMANKAVEPTAPMAALWHAGVVHGAAAHRQRWASCLPA